MSLHVVSDVTIDCLDGNLSDDSYAGYVFPFSPSYQNSSSLRKSESTEENEGINEDGFVEINTTSDPFVIVSTDEIYKQIGVFIANRNQLSYFTKCSFIGNLSVEYLSDQRIIDFAREIFLEVSNSLDDKTCHSLQQRVSFTRGVRRIFQQKLSDVCRTIPDMGTISNSKREEIQWLERIIGSFLY